MAEEIPQIEPIEKASSLYDAYQKSREILGPTSSSRRVLSITDLRGLEGFVSNERPFLAVANSFDAMNHDLGDFRRNMEETLEYTIKYIRGQFNGMSEDEIRSVSSLLGLIPITTSAGESKGKMSGNIDLGVYDIEKLTNTVPSNHQWLKDFLGQYVTEINEALDSIGDGEPNPRLKVGIDRMNNAIEDCYREENVTRLKFACQNLSGGHKYVREMMFPTNSRYPERGDFLRDSKDYIASIKKLIEFAKGKEKVEFENHSDLSISLFEL